MRVLVLENDPSTHRGGQELSLFDVCRGLASGGHRIDLLYRTPGNLLDGYRRFAASTTQVAAYNVDRTHTVRAAARLVLDALRARPTPDVIYANQYFDSPFARLVAARTRRPFVCHLRLPPPDRFCFQYRWGMSAAVRLIAISQRTREEYASRGFDAGRIDVVYNGIDFSRMRPPSRAEARARFGLSPQAFALAFVGRLHPAKGLHVLLEALPHVDPSMELLIAGAHHDDGSGRNYGAELRHAAEALGIASRCRFLGQIDDVAALFAAADLTIVPSVFSEAFGRTIVESLACGTPVVASRIGGIPEVLAGEFDCWLVAPGDPRALAVAIGAARARIAHDPDLSGRCRAFAEGRFGVERMVAGVESVFQQVVDEWRRGAAIRVARRVAA